MRNIEIALLQESELTEAENICKLAFGTFIGLLDPMSFGNGAEYAPRWYRDPQGAFAAKKEGKLIGYTIAANWGSYGGFGPVVVHPDYWDKGIASMLMVELESKFKEWGTQHISFCTFPNSPKHLWLYGKFGFAPRFLIAVCGKAIALSPQPLKAERFSQLSFEQQIEAKKAAYELTNQIFEGLDMTNEITLVQNRHQGDTLMLWDDEGLLGFAICHYGAGSEAELDTCYVKFGAARWGKKAKEGFEQLLDNCETLCNMVGTSKLVVGVDTACYDAYRRILARKYQVQLLLLSMHQPNTSGYSREDVYILDDRR